MQHSRAIAWSYSWRDESFCQHAYVQSNYAQRVYVDAIYAGTLHLKACMWHAFPQVAVHK